MTASNSFSPPYRPRGLKHHSCNAGYPGGYSPQQGYPQQGYPQQSYQQQYPQQQGGYPPQVLCNHITHAPKPCTPHT